ncbi:MAG: hypothetical protein KC421_02005 [Anaerolineales bacterium]|nr:hypothetical protein [Anaerolineales bacterium]
MSIFKTLKDYLENLFNPEAGPVKKTKTLGEKKSSLHPVRSPYLTSPVSQKSEITVHRKFTREESEAAFRMVILPRMPHLSRRTKPINEKKDSSAKNRFLETKGGNNHE